MRVAEGRGCGWGWRCRGWDGSGSVVGGCQEFEGVQSARVQKRLAGRALMGGVSSGMVVEPGALPEEALRLAPLGTLSRDICYVEACHKGIVIVCSPHDLFRPLCLLVGGNFCINACEASPTTLPCRAPQCSHVPSQHPSWLGIH